MKYLLKGTYALSIFVMFLIVISTANAGELVSVVEAEYVRPAVGPPSASIANGGFFISGYGRGPSMGEGIDERTVWFHSFRLDRPQWRAFKTADPAIIHSAILELEYTPYIPSSPKRPAANDYVQMVGLKGIFIGGGHPLDSRGRRRISIDLLADNRYTSNDILGVLHNPSKDPSKEGFKKRWNGNILMRYADDAIIHYAKLTLGYNSSAQKCSAQVQGKIAWDYKGNKQWDQVNLERLCRGAENSGEPAACFQRVMHGGVNWGGGTQWEWENAIDLCEGSEKAASTIQCFEQELTKNRTWQQAIRSCSN